MPKPITNAPKGFVENEQQFLAAVAKGKQALREDRMIDHATVVAAFERIILSHP